MSAPLCSCSVTSLALPHGDLVVLHITGEVDVSTIDILRTAVADALALRPDHLVVDLSKLTFCSVRGLTELVDAGRTAARNGTGYAVGGASTQVIRAWTVMWPEQDLPVRFPTASLGVRAARHRRRPTRATQEAGRVPPVPPPGRAGPRCPSDRTGRLHPADTGHPMSGRHRLRDAPARHLPTWCDAAMTVARRLIRLSSRRGS